MMAAVHNIIRLISVFTSSHFHVIILTDSFHDDAYAGAERKFQLWTIPAAIERKSGKIPRRGATTGRLSIQWTRWISRGEFLFNKYFQSTAPFSAGGFFSSF